MNITPRPHDLLWLHEGAAPEGINEAWVAHHWTAEQPVVVRRDVMCGGKIPVGVRGSARHQRAAGWVRAEDVKHEVTPEALLHPAVLDGHPFKALPTVQALVQLCQHQWPWIWGVTGSTGFALATSLPVLHESSDVDLLIRAPLPLPASDFDAWQQIVNTLSCRADTQIETPSGAFALNEWLRGGRVLLKTARGPRLTNLPWAEEIS